MNSNNSTQHPVVTKAKPYHDLWPLLTLLLLALVMWAGEQLSEPPSVHIDPISATEFSAQRAQQHVNKIAALPHPSGSDANAEVRDYLINQLQTLGAEVELQQKLQPYEYKVPAGQARFAFVENIVARWPGKESGPALLLMAHYDSVPYGPGAGDDASGVAAELETIRALLASGLPMRNPLMVFFSDGEESGLLGAQAFFGHHRWAEEVALVLNFDSRGSRGPVYMYETSPNNGALIDALSLVVASPAANSLVYSIFQKMPNFSDLQIAIKAGKAGMNFAFIDGYSDYHSSTDTASRLSLESLQHLGSYALPLVRYFGEQSLPVKQISNQHYFNPVGHLFVNYQSRLDWFVWVLVVALFGFATVKALQNGTYRLSGLFRGFGCAFLVVALPALLVLVLDLWLGQSITNTEVLVRQRGWFIAWALFACGIAVWLQGSLRSGLSSKSSWLVILIPVALTLLADTSWILLLIVAIMAISLVLLLQRPLPREVWIASGQWLLVLFALLTLLMLEDGAYVLIWPLLTIALLQAWGWRSAESFTIPIVWLLAALPAINMLGSTALMFDLMVGYELPIVAMLPLLLLLLLISPLIEGNSARNTGFGVTLLGIIGLSWLSLTTPWTNEKLQPTDLFVLHDANKQLTYWASEDLSLTDWHKEALGIKPIQENATLYQPSEDKPVWLAPIQGLIIEVPQLELLAADKEQHLLRVKLKPGHAGDSLTVWLPPDADLKSLQVEGRPLQWKQDAVDQWNSISGFSLPAQGVELTMVFGVSDHWPELLLTGEHYGLPDSLELPARGTRFNRRSYSHSDTTMTVRHVKIDQLVSVAIR